MLYNFIGRGLRYSAQAILALLAVLLLFEGIVRTFGLYRPGMYYRDDPSYEWTLPAGTEIAYGLEGFGHTHYLADGEIATPYNDGAEVLIFGDSHTEGRQVNDEFKFVSVAETILRRRGRIVNLRNFGKSGADFADYVYFVQQASQRDSLPRAIVLQVDEEDFDWHAFDSERVNFFAWDPEGKLTLVHHSPSPGKWALRWFERIFLYYPLHERWNLLQEHWNTPIQTPRRPAAPEADIERSVAAESELMAQAAKGIPLLILRTSYTPFVEPPHHPATVTFDTLRKVEPWPIIDPAAAFVRMREQDHIDARTFSNAPPNYAHFNRNGNAVLGQALADGLEAFLFPDEVSPQ